MISKQIIFNLIEKVSLKKSQKIYRINRQVVVRGRNVLNSDSFSGRNLSGQTTPVNDGANKTLLA